MFSSRGGSIAGSLRRSNEESQCMISSRGVLIRTVSLRRV